MRFFSDRERISVAVIGLGYVGSTVAAVLADGDVDVVGIDIDPEVVARLNERRVHFSEPGLPELLNAALDSRRLRATTGFDDVGTVDVVIIAVNTPVREGGLVDVYLSSACAEVGRRLRPGQLVILKSTVPPGVSRSLAVPVLESGGLRAGEDFGVVFCPERLSEGQALHELRTFPIAIGGHDPDAAAAAAAFWRRTLGAEVLPCGSLEAAEMVKLANNWWIDHNIAMANELAKLCGVLDVDVLEVIAAANTMRKNSGNVNILLPGVGVGGSCLTKDPWMVWQAGRDHDIDLRTVPVAREVNDTMPGYTADLVARELALLDRPLAGARIAVLGVAFKNNTGDLRATPTLPVVAALRDGGADVVLHDPLAEPGEVAKLFGQTPVPDVRDALAGADCIAVLARHDVFDELDFAELRPHVAEHCVVIDGRAHYPAATVERLRGLGYAYRGIGR
ncbi:nucleotide sugar dehydrogenase [Actinomadura flavalba]|uniref:nucleotide sugar dehydrogenase n=1 Tax=Actinomadura flavalba TaxID=1120938 RepID=UPI00035C478B|nr:nucleotide sugar dehydrogenase [Actinomadura flavalba]